MGSHQAGLLAPKHENHGFPRWRVIHSDVAWDHRRAVRPGRPPGGPPMATATLPPSAFRPAAARRGDDHFVPLAAELGAQLAERAAEHDHENLFVHDNFRILKDA